MYAPINGWTKTKIIDHIKKEFKGRSTDETGTICLYRGTNGRKCAVGMFIPDEIYNESFEGSSISYLDPSVHGVMPLPIKAMSELQALHDNPHGDSDFILDSMLSFVKENVENILDISND